MAIKVTLAKKSKIFQMLSCESMVKNFIFHTTYIHRLLPLLHGGLSEAIIKTKVYIYNKN